MRRGGSWGDGRRRAAALVGNFGRRRRRGRVGGRGGLGFGWGVAFYAADVVVGLWNLVGLVEPKSKRPHESC